MPDMKSNDPFTRIAWFIFQSFLIILFVFGIVRMLRHEWLTLW